MDYQITCVCGHSFQISDEEIEQQISCPACQRRLNPVVVAPRANGPVAAAAPAVPAEPTAAATPAPAAGTPAEARVEATKRCPFCGEVILAIARKCKHCGEFLDRGSSEGAMPPPAAAGAAAAAASVPATGPGEVMFALSISQWDNFWKFTILLTAVAGIAAVMLFIQSLQGYAAVVILASLVFAGFIGWFFYLSARHTRVIVRPFRIDTESGILSKKLDSMELFRISDVQLKQGLVERLLGIGTVNLMTNDSSNQPELVLYQIPRAREVYRYLQTQIPIAAKQRGAIYMEK